MVDLKKIKLLIFGGMIFGSSIFAMWNGQDDDEEVLQLVDEINAVDLVPRDLQAMVINESLARLNELKRRAKPIQNLLMNYGAILRRNNGEEIFFNGNQILSLKELFLAVNALKSDSQVAYIKISREACLIRDRLTKDFNKLALI